MLIDTKWLIFSFHWSWREIRYWVFQGILSPDIKSVQNHQATKWALPWHNDISIWCLFLGGKYVVSSACPCIPGRPLIQQLTNQECFFVSGGRDARGGDRHRWPVGGQQWWRASQQTAGTPLVTVCVCVCVCPLYMQMPLRMPRYRGCISEI